MNRLPFWFRQPFPRQDKVLSFKDFLQDKNIHTVCQSAHCPNLMRCWKEKVATFMILGDICTRSCRFCAVQSGIPGQVNAGEPGAIADVVCEIGLRYVVITSVTRDDLDDQGVHQFCKVIHAIRSRDDKIRIELLIPDFDGDASLIEELASARPDVVGHNIETVCRLTPVLRPQADYNRSLGVLGIVKKYDPQIFLKSGLMLGFGEEEGEILDAMQDLLRSGCDILTLGQYLAPSQEARHVPVKRFVSPEEFDRYRKKALALGFKSVISGPLVRSSYMAQKVYETCRDSLIAAGKLSQ